MRKEKKAQLVGVRRPRFCKGVSGVKRGIWRGRTGNICREEDVP